MPRFVDEYLTRFQVSGAETLTGAMNQQANAGRELQRVLGGAGIMAAGYGAGMAADHFAELARKVELSKTEFEGLADEHGFGPQEVADVYKMVDATAALGGASKEAGIAEAARMAAMGVAVKRVQDAKRIRGLFP